MQLTFKQEGSSDFQVEILKALCGDSKDKTLIDLCCGFAPQTSKVPFRQKTFVDAVERPLHGGGEMITANVIEFLKSNTKNSIYDVSISTDSIEHFREKDALQFVELTSKIAKKNIWFTPLGEFCMTDDPNDNDPDTHKSEWTPEKLDKLMPDYWAYLVFPNWHPTLRNSKNEVLGAFFFWHCDNLKEDFKRVESELKHFL
jgi:hypothetical protein